MPRPKSDEQPVASLAKKPRKPLSARANAAKKARKARAALPKFKQKRAAGRPTVYEAEAHCARAYKLALLGLTDLEIAEQFGISELTLNRWKAEYPQFCKSLNDGKVPADAEMAASMYKRGLGFEYPAVKIFAPPTPGAAPVYAPYMAYQPGDVGAQKSWLFNRQGMRWKDRQQVDVGGTIERRIAAMTPAERAADARAFAIRLRQAIAEARRARAEQRTIEGEATEVEED
jgi:hypothetical protein